MPDTVVYTWEEHGWLKHREPTYRPDAPCFLIVCDAGDWSGFRTLEQCLAQNPDPSGRRPAGFYRIVER